MTVAFTICSNNYLSQAKALADSVKSTDPDIKFYVGLVDDFENIPAAYRSTFDRETIIEVPIIQIPNLDWMKENYDIVELNTATKPFYFQYLFDLHPEATKFIFLDPDILVYRSLGEIEDLLDKHSIIFTPHLTEPINDDRHTFQIHEPDILNHGIYNLGFVAINTSANAKHFINWWADRLLEQCKHDLCHGLFVDQLWCNLVPGFYDDVLISRHLGYNMAYWNLQERTLSIKDGTYMVNDRDPLLFFHFSTFNPAIENNIAVKQNRYKLSDRPDLIPLYKDYEQKVRKNHYEELKNVNCVYGRRPKPVKRYKRVRSAATKPLKWIVRIIEEVV